MLKFGRILGVNFVVTLKVKDESILWIPCLLQKCSLRTPLLPSFQTCARVLSNLANFTAEGELTD